MTKFERCFEMLMDNEGGYADVSGDPGGRTFCGVSERAHAETFRRLMRAPDAAARRDILLAFYRAEYWTPMHCDEYPMMVAYRLFDSCVLCGVKRATMFLQRACNMGGAHLAVDGKFGPATLSESTGLAKRYPRNLAGALIYLLGEYLMGLDGLKKFHWGWVRRLEDDDIEEG